MKKIFLIVMFQVIFSSYSFASGEVLPYKKMNWPFDGFFGVVDRQAAQRGFKVYREVCSVCHSMKLLAYRNLSEIGFLEDEIKSVASEAEVKDGPDGNGEFFMRPGLPSDRFVSPYPNENAARSANNGALPPDFSLIVKARVDGANYIYSLLKGFEERPPSQKEIPSGMYYNPYFQNSLIAMSPPLSEGQVSFDDGTESSIHQMSKDVVVFLQWASEPEMEKRKAMGVKVLLYLIILTGFFIAAKEIIWRNVK